MTVLQAIITLTLVVPVLVIVVLQVIDVHCYPDKERPPITGDSTGGG